MAIPSSLPSLLLLLLLLLLFSSPSSPQPCPPPSSCGDLTDIHYPFSLKHSNSPSYCTEPGYELTCNSKTNKTIINILSNNYYVSNISYTNSTMHLIDVSMSNGSCNLPLHSLPYTQLVSKTNFNPIPQWANFVNCSQEINNSIYKPLPCLSSNGRFIYVNFDSFGGYSQNLMVSCSFISMIPIDHVPSGNDDDVFQILAKGFQVYWGFGDLTMSWLFYNCLDVCKSMFKENIRSDVVFSGIVSLVRSEKHFPACLDDYSGMGLNNFKLIFCLSIVVVVLILSIQLLIVLALIGRFVIAPLTICAFLLYKWTSMMVSNDFVERFLRNHQQTLAPTRYSYTDIIAMTSHFREKLGQGGFGSVYKGRLPGDRLIAVKLLRNSKSNGDDFINEVSTIGMIHHVNVVKLIGFCSEGSDRALVYEYMPNGSLDKYIFSSSNSNNKFSSAKLNEIALGIARGINYLHQGCDMRILHFDIKPHNILLDHNFTPKVSDFGLAKLYPRDNSLVAVSAVRGTIGYMAPELISRSFGVISYKSDVYSFGMLLLEMASGKRNADPKVGTTSQIYYPSWIYDKLNPINAETEIITEPDIVINETEKKLCMVGLWCIQIRPMDRPPMSKVVEMLEGDVDSLQMPPKPFFAASKPQLSPTLFLNSTEDAEHTTISEDD
ncbi:rust resistance kinase Lr10-like [Dioscorea cayenensis subsp. rotundata]|uniref:Rust resistance kinase Lr10-like n=1 Tax=Dioscorea cayennensis subsp. rotundata TaxID=55577 RepID=A0AB40B7S2_DIOCR|nr:rust resistance kinase Lr10-like [Dioscorea cayenensis subsp. rotundata]